MEVIRETPKKITFQRPWGTADAIPLESNPGTFDICVETIIPGGVLFRHIHPVETEREIVLCGDGWLLLEGGQRIRISGGIIEGDHEVTGNEWEPGDVHGYEADPDGEGLRILTLTSPPWQEGHEIPIE